MTDSERQMISRETVEWGYRLILGREPENEAVIAEKMACTDQAALSNQLIYSEEFVNKNPRFMPLMNKWVLVEHEVGIRIWVNLADTGISWPIVRNDFERAEIKFLSGVIKPGQTVFDIGANIGFFSMLFSKLVGPEGRVIAFEPLPFLHERAVMSAYENGFGHCTIHNVALAKERGTVALVYAPGSPNWGGAFLSFDGSVLPGHASVPVPTCPLSDFVDGDLPSLIKIDVEGAEHTVMSDAVELLAEARPIVVSEIHRTQLERVSGVEPSDYIDLFRNLGYKCLEIAKDGTATRELIGHEEFQLVNVVFMP
ncbi:FkbM family methyltransferase [Erythrobacter dokdonensis]|nr:FkbM family methyltransferase [Erythrobacter dokdonensis]